MIFAIRPTIVAEVMVLRAASGRVKCSVLMDAGGEKITVDAIYLSWLWRNIVREQW
jgi:hypothetical protein